MDAKTKVLLDRLPQTKLRELRDYATLRLSHGIARNDRKDDDIADMCIEVICETMRSRGLDLTTPPALIGKSKQYREFRRKLELDGLSKFFRSVCDRNRVKLRAFIRLSMDLLADDLRSMDVATSATTLMNHIHRVPAVLDVAFPGYAQAGLLNWVIREESHVGKERDHETISPRQRRPDGQ